MNILYDHQIFIDQSYGGPSRYFFNIIEEIKKKENLKISAPIHINQYLSELPKSLVYGHNINYLMNENIPFRIREIIRNKLIDKINIFYWKKSIKNFKPDILHKTYYDNYEKTKIPTVLTVYDLIHEKYHELYQKKKDYRPKEKAIKNADKIICISQNTKKDLIQYYDVDQKKIEVIYLASNINKKGELLNRDIAKIPFKNFILFVGKRLGYKNFDNLIKVYANSNQLKKDFKIICFGGGAFSKSEKEKFKNLKLDKKNIIQIFGNDLMLSQLYKNARALIYPSLYEGFGLPILEAMSLNCAVICGNTSSMTEVGGNAVLYFDPNNLDEMASVIEKNIYSNEILDNLINLGKERAKLFSWQKCGQETLDCYNQLIF
jgi:glycosyltransferase involved in cell wall biosynthesis